MCVRANFADIYLQEIRHFHIPHNTPCLPPKNLHNRCFPFPLGITVVPRESEDNAYAKFWGANKVYYGGMGGCGNGKCVTEVYEAERN